MLINLLSPLTLVIFELRSMDFAVFVRGTASCALLQHLASTFEAQILRNKGRMKTGES